MFRTRQFLVEMFGNPQGVVSFLRAYDVDAPDAATVQKWFARESVPASWLPVLLAYLEIDRGDPVSLVSYIDRGGHKK